MEHISHFHRQMQRIKDDVLSMAGLVEESIHDACQSLAGRDLDLARRVVQGDRRVDVMQNGIEERCITLLATQQPVAVDLRFLAAVIKICAYLERMGDQAVNVAQRAQALAELPAMDLPPTLLTMGDIARGMVGDSLDALVQENVRLATQVLRRDDELDALNRSFLEEMIGWMTREHRLIRRGVEFILAARHLERLGDEATNIAEEVIYLVEGRVVRHLSLTEAGVGPL